MHEAISSVNCVFIYFPYFFALSSRKLVEFNFAAGGREKSSPYHDSCDNDASQQVDNFFIIFYTSAWVSAVVNLTSQTTFASNPDDDVECYHHLLYAVFCTYFLPFEISSVASWTVVLFSILIIHWLTHTLSPSFYVFFLLSCIALDLDFSHPIVHAAGESTHSAGINTNAHENYRDCETTT